MVYSELMSQTHLKDLFSKIEITYDEVSNSIKYDLKNVISQLSIYSQDLIVEFATALKGLGLDTVSNYFDPLDPNCFYTKFTKNSDTDSMERELKWKLDTIGTVSRSSGEIWIPPQPLPEASPSSTNTQNTALATPMTASSPLDGFWSGDAADNQKKINLEYNFTLHGMTGNDVLYGGSRNDSIWGCSDNDTLDGGDGDDILCGNFDNDLIFGGNGNDTIYGGKDDDTIYGGAGDDFINADEEGFPDGNYLPGNDVISGGRGNDTIRDYFGDEIYLFEQGDGMDTLLDASGYDVVKFGEGITWENLTFEQSGQDLILIVDSSDQIRFRNWFNTDFEYSYSNNYKIECFQFADGTTHYTNEIPVGDNSENLFAGTNNQDKIIGTIYNDTLEGYLGDDYLCGGLGNDTYIYNPGDGADYIVDTSGTDKIKLGEGITRDNIIYTKEENNLVIRFNGIDGQIFVENHFGDSNYRIENIEFFDGTSISTEDISINDIQSRDDIIMPEGIREAKLIGDGDKNVTGNDMNNHIIGNSGNNVLSGGAGIDVYTFFENWGQDTVIDSGEYSVLNIVKPPVFGPSLKLVS